MKFLLNKQKGETLIEVITALTALVMAGVAAVTVIISVMQANAISKDYLIAQNLAREGIEGVITIRNTNWLKYPSTKATDWRCIADNGTACTQRFEKDKHYILNRENAASGWKFFLEEKLSAQLELSDGTKDPEFELKLTPLGQTNIYTHTGTQSSPQFYRMITFEEVTAGNTDKYKVTAKIQWESKSQVNTYVLTSIITNYAK